MRRLINLLAPAYRNGRGMKGLAWSRQLSIGNVVIDAEHRNLIRIVNDAIRAVESRDCLTLLQELEHLESWLRTHGTHEETIAQSVNFPIAMLKSAQQYSQNTFRHLKDEMEGQYGRWSDNTVVYLSHLLQTWVIGHITAVDMPMKSLLQTCDYHFWPSYTAEEAYGPVPATPDAYKSRCGCGCGCDYNSVSSAVK
ncbi:MAG: hemerythrin family protein [Candidatus Ferrigenium altingense]|jgi:hemerythrin-like metal-binding protein